MKHGVGGDASVTGVAAISAACVARRWWQTLFCRSEAEIHRLGPQWVSPADYTTSGAAAIVTAITTAAAAAAAAATIVVAPLQHHGDGTSHNRISSAVTPLSTAALAAPCKREKKNLQEEQGLSYEAGRGIYRA